MIVDALFNLMKRKSFRQITVTEICEEAAIGRKTFYRNFEQREDVIDFWLDLLYVEYEQEFLHVPLEEKLYYHCVFLKKHTDELITLYQNGLHPMVEKKFAAFLPNTMPIWSENCVEQEYRSQYVIAGVEAVIRVWVTRGFQESIEEIVEIIKRAHDRQIPMNILM